MTCYATLIWIVMFKSRLNRWTSIRHLLKHRSMIPMSQIHMWLLRGGTLHIAHCRGRGKVKRRWDDKALLPVFISLSRSVNIGSCSHILVYYILVYAGIKWAFLVLHLRKTPWSNNWQSSETRTVGAVASFRSWMDAGDTAVGFKFSVSRFYHFLSHIFMPVLLQKSIDCNQ